MTIITRIYVAVKLFFLVENVLSQFDFFSLFQIMTQKKIKI